MRAVDQRLDELLDGLPAVAVDGAKGVGKTSTARRRAATVVSFDDPDEIELTSADPGRLARLPAPVLVDEWQRYPRSWDLVRRAVDDGARAGAFLLTGSASPRASVHSGAGRIVRVRMRPMGLAERGVVEPTVSLASLMSGERPEVRGSTTFGLREYAEEIVRSGFPGIRGLPERRRADAITGYLDAVVEHDFEELGHVVRRPEALRRWLAAFAAATSTTASYNAILDAATAGESDKPAKTTSIAYRDTLARLWLLDELPAWTGSPNHLLSLGQVPKHHLADPALVAGLLGVGADALAEGAGPAPVPRDGLLVGALFESLVTLGVRVAADVRGDRVSHFRTRRGDHEVDLVVQRSDGRALAIEVKLARTAQDADVKHLRWLREQLGDDLLDAVVVTTGPEAYRRSDGIAVVPAALLGP